MKTCSMPVASRGNPLVRPFPGLAQRPASDTTAACETGPGAAEGSACPLRTLFRVHRWQILATYVLFNLENLGRLAQPWFLGWAVNDLLAGRSTGLLVLAAQHLANLALGACRQAYDTRTFTRIYANLASGLAVGQRRRGVDLSRLSARSALSRELVDFFERDVPFLFHALYSVGGSLVMIALFDGVLVIPCLLFLAVSVLLTRSLARRTLQLNRGLNDQLEREVSILQHAPADGIEEHYHQVRGWRIRLGNAQLANFGSMGLLTLLLLATVLVRSCDGRATDAGTLFSILGYVVLLTNSLSSLPLWIQQFSRLQDIRHRLRPEPGPRPANE